MIAIIYIVEIDVIYPKMKHIASLELITSLIRLLLRNASVILTEFHGGDARSRPEFLRLP